MADQNNSNMSLENFVNNLIKEKGLEGLEEEILVQIKKDLQKRLEDRINVAIATHIPPEKMEFFEGLLDKADEKEIQQFCQRNISNLAEITANELVGFRKSYLGVE